jgi:hypothetical protein
MAISQDGGEIQDDGHLIFALNQSSSVRTFF